MEEDASQGERRNGELQAMGGRQSAAAEDRQTSSRKRKYIPQENSAPYALLITLFRARQSGHEFMLKEELLNEAELSGLCRTNLRPDKTHAGPGGTQSSASWYSGWNSMGKLIEKGLVMKWSSPAKYTLTEDGFNAAIECMVRSSLMPREHEMKWIPPATYPERKEMRKGTSSKASSHSTSSAVRQPLSTMSKTPSNSQDRENEVVPESLADSGAAQWLPTDGNRGTLEVHGERRRQAAAQKGRPPVGRREGPPGDAMRHWEGARQGVIQVGSGESLASARRGSDNTRESLATLQQSHGHASFLPSGTNGERRAVCAPQQDFAFTSAVCIPHLQVSERFGDAYDIVICLDNQEKFEITRGERKTSKIAELLSRQYHLLVDLRSLPVGDVLWIARRKDEPQEEYVLDFILERKRVDDLWESIKTKRFRDQKLRLRKCGLKVVFYLIEGDPDLQESAVNLKTAAYQTEIEEEFDVQRTMHWSGEGGTVERYAELTIAIRDRYALEVGSSDTGTVRAAMTYGEFRTQCSIVREPTISEIFGSMLSQIHSVTEDVAQAIMQTYPTLPALVQAYQRLEGNRRAQETLLTSLVVKNKKISDLISKRVFEKIWC